MFTGFATLYDAPRLEKLIRPSMLPLLTTVSTGLTFDEIGLIVLSGSDFVSTRVAPMSHTWFQLVPEVHVYTDTVPDSAWPLLETNARSNMIFHLTDAYPRHLVGTEWEDKWQNAQTRHLHAIADFYERYPDKKFYMVVDDDTFVLPDNVLSVFENVDPDSVIQFGNVMRAI
jgi:hypothetical protein